MQILDQDIFNSLPEGPEVDAENLVPLGEALSKVNEAVKKHQKAVLHVNQERVTDSEGDDDSVAPDQFDVSSKQNETGHLRQTPLTETQNHRFNKLNDLEASKCDTACETSDDGKKVPRARYQMIDNVRSYFCDSCNFTRSSKPAVRAHILKEHTDRQQLKCTTCPYQTWNPSCFTQHVKRCQNRKQCPFCSYSTTKVSDLKRHCSRWHKNDKKNK